MALQLDTTSSVLAGAAFGVVRPGDPDYDARRRSFNLAVEQFPAAIAYPETPADVAACVRAATAAGLRVAVQGGTHNAGPLGALDGTLLVRTERMAAVEVDPVRRIARVGAGARWGAVVEAAAPYGLVGLHGSSPTVGVAGMSLGGGIGWLTRRHGLQVNRITALEVVLADGTVLRVDHEHEPELFWGLRGGGANVGVVTALEFGLLELSHAYAGWLVWDLAHAERVLQRFAVWAPEAADAITTSTRILRLPPLPEIPEPLRGRDIVVVSGAAVGPEDEAAELLAPLRELRPELDTWGTVPAPALCRLHGDPEEPMPVVAGSAMLSHLDAGTVSAVVAAAGKGSGSPLAMVELRQLGGAAARPVPGGGAVSSFDGRFLAFTGGLPGEGVAEHVEHVVGLLEPCRGGRPYLNFEEAPFETATAIADAARLRALRDRVDPGGLLQPNHPL